MFDPLAETVGLASVSETETPVLPQTLVSIPPATYSYLPIELKANIPAKGAFEVADTREIAFYVMNEGNFSQWHAGHPSAVLLAKPAATSYNFTLTPLVDGTYYFIFDNSDPSGRNVLFSLNTVQSSIAPSPIVQFAGYEIAAIGIVLLFLGIRGGGKKPKPIQAPAPTPTAITGWSCKYCGTNNSNDETFCQKCGRSHR